MEPNLIILGTVIALLVFGPYFLGLFQGHPHPIRWREVFRGLTWQGLTWAGALPAVWVALYYALIARVWWSLGRWPRFGETLSGAFFPIHHATVWFLFGALLASLGVAPVILIGSMFLRRFQPVFFLYLLCYGAAVGLASCALFFLAPQPFRNWFFD